MKRTTYIILFITLIATAIVSGWYLNRNSILFDFSITLTISAFLISSMVVGIYDYFNKSRFFLIPIFVLFFLTVSILSSSYFQTQELIEKKELSNQIIAAVNDFYSIHGEYPKTLKEIGLDQIKHEIDYYINYEKGYYEIIYQTSNRHTNHYLSSKNEWIEIGF